MIFKDINNKVELEKFQSDGYIVKTYYDLENKLYGYTKFGDYNVGQYFDEKVGNTNVYLPELKDKVFFDNFNGIYREKCFLKTLGKGYFPYCINREYEAIYNLDLFSNTAFTKRNEDFNLAKNLKYTFGFEFETSCGYVPQELCFKNGLIPLRDGSISGVEYSSIIIEGNKGLNLLKDQIETLKKYTLFNKECSLHFHIGNYPLSEKHIFNLYQLFYFIQNEFERLIPDYSFNTYKYKSNGKDYCSKLDRITSFNELYNLITTKNYNNSLTEPHPYDVDRNRKWNITQRYKNINFVNMLCYDNPKTIEIRFLRPTYNFNKIILWLYIFNALLLYAEKYTKLKFKDITKPNFLKYLSFHDVTLMNILKEIYDEETVEKIKEGLDLMASTKETQIQNRDFCGEKIEIENFYFNDFEIN